MRLDLSDLKSVRKFVKRCSKRRLAVDYLINNAGVMVPPYTLTKQDFESQFGVNHLAHFLLTNLMLEAGLINEGGRIVNLSSSVARLLGKMHWEDLQWTKSYSPWTAYGQSKLCNVLFTIELQNRLQALGKNITSYCVDPGAVKTDLQRHPNWLTVLFEPIRRFFYKTPLQGAQTSLFCALEPHLEAEAGKFFADSRVVSKVPQTFNYADAAKLWTLSEQLVGQAYLTSISE
jgi:NAD(P)-dependent dehydrogenase (short-subunit alcohol dehydrogenase family)